MTKKIILASLIFAFAIFMGMETVMAAGPVYLKKMNPAVSAKTVTYKKGAIGVLSSNYRITPTMISQINNSVRYNPVSTTINACPPIGAPRPGNMQCGTEGGFPVYCTGSYEKIDNYGCFFSCQLSDGGYRYSGSPASVAFSCTEVGAMN